MNKGRVKLFVSETDRQGTKTELNAENTSYYLYDSRCQGGNEATMATAHEFSLKSSV
jgi:hypothetical protein